MLLDSKIKDIVNLPLKPKGMIGVEIEVEGINRLPSEETVAPTWVKTMDGSLRGKDNAEFILPVPLDKEETFKAIDFLKDAFTLCKSKIKDTVRAGVHIHINSLGATFRELWTFTTCYYVLEEALIARFCGEGRSGNHFCLRAVDADILTYIINKAIRSEDLSELARDDFRYAALNLTSLFRHGSIEFRALRTPTDFNKIKTWIDILLSIKEGSKRFKNPREVVEYFSMGGEFNFAQQMLGDYIGELGPLNDELRAMLIRGVRIAQEIGYSTKGW